MKVFHGRFTKNSDEEDIRAMMKIVIERLDSPFYGYANRTSTIDRFVEIIKKDKFANHDGLTKTLYTIPNFNPVFEGENDIRVYVKNFGDYYLQYTIKYYTGSLTEDAMYDIMIFKHEFVATDDEHVKSADGSYRIKCTGLKDYIGKEDPSDVNETTPDVNVETTSIPTPKKDSSKHKEKKAIKVMIKPNRNTIESIKSIIDDLDNKIEKLGRYMDDYIQDITEDLENSSKKLKEVLKGIGIK